MEINEIAAVIEDVQDRINEIKEMMIDFENCKNSTSKQYLLAAINKITLSLKSNINQTK